MKISLIENGLDSLQKGYSHLENYERLIADGAGDSKRFFALKDSILSIQHGIEILFKFVLKEHNELLIFTDISAKLKQAFRNRRNGGPAELYETDGVHTVTYKESIERLRDICGLPLEDRFKDILLKVEGWRNSITHSAVLLRETEVSRVLMSLLEDLDILLGPVIGKPYFEGQGRTELDRAYRLTKAVHGELENKIKALTVERLIGVLKAQNIKHVTSPGVFLISDAGDAYAALKDIQGGGIKYGCDFINGHCSGSASIEGLSKEGLIEIYTDDNQTTYQFELDSIVIYIPQIQNSFSPLIFMYSKQSSPVGSGYKIEEDTDFVLQHGIVLHSDATEFWDREHYEQSVEDDASDEAKLPDHSQMVRFLSKGPVCFMNVQGLEFGSALHLLDRDKYGSGNLLLEAFTAGLAKNDEAC